MSKFVCPSCGSDKLEEINTVTVRYPIMEWNDEGEPTGFGESVVEWDSVQRVEGNYYFCTKCTTEFTQNRLERVLDQE